MEMEYSLAQNSWLDTHDKLFDGDDGSWLKSDNEVHTFGSVGSSIESSPTQYQSALAQQPQLIQTDKPNHLVVAYSLPCDVSGQITSIPLSAFPFYIPSSNMNQVFLKHPTLQPVTFFVAPPPFATSANPAASDSLRSHPSPVPVDERKRKSMRLPQSTSAVTETPTTPVASPTASSNGTSSPGRRARATRPKVVEGKGAIQCQGINRKKGTQCKNAALMEYIGPRPIYCAEHIELDPLSLYEKCNSPYQKEPKDGKGCKEVVLKEFGFCYKHFNDVVNNLVTAKNVDTLKSHLNRVIDLVNQLEKEASAAKKKDCDLYQRKNKLIPKFQEMKKIITKAIDLVLGGSSTSSPIHVEKIGVPVDSPSKAAHSPVSSSSSPLEVKPFSIETFASEDDKIAASSTSSSSCSSSTSIPLHSTLLESMRSLDSSSGSCADSLASSDPSSPQEDPFLLSGEYSVSSGNSPLFDDETFCPLAN